MKTTSPIATDRLILRRFTPEDAVPMFENWASDPEVTRFLTWNPHRDPGETLRVISSWVDQYPLGILDWCITLRRDGSPVGSITAVQEHPSLGYCELGMCLSRELWGRGIMTEACGAVIRYIFESTRYASVRARYDIENPASGRVLEKCGMGVLGERLSADRHGRERLYVHMGISRADFRR